MFLFRESTHLSEYRSVNCGKLFALSQPIMIQASVITTAELFVSSFGEIIHLCLAKHTMFHIRFMTFNCFSNLGPHILAKQCQQKPALNSPGVLSLVPHPYLHLLFGIFFGLFCITFKLALRTSSRQLVFRF